MAYNIDLPSFRIFHQSISSDSGIEVAKNGKNRKKRSFFVTSIPESGEIGK